MLSGNLNLQVKDFNFNINYNDNSHMAPVQSIICKFGKIDFGITGWFKIYKCKNIDNLNRKHQYSDLEQVYTGNFNCSKKNPFTKCLLDSHQGLGVDIQDGIDSTKILLSAIINSQEYEGNFLSDNFKKNDINYDKNWNFT